MIWDSLADRALAVLCGSNVMATSLVVGWVIPDVSPIIPCLLSSICPQCIERQCQCIYLKSKRGGARYPRSKPPASHQRRSPSDTSFVSDVEREWECESRRCQASEAKVQADTEPAHIASLSTPGSGLLHVDDSMATMTSGCCSLPTQPTELPRPAPNVVAPVSLAQTSEFDETGLDDPIRAYGSDQTL